jgi:hypothetical protein
MNDGARETQYAAVVMHTNGAKVPKDGDLFNWWSKGAELHVGAHLQITNSGKLYQYLDTDRYTGHAWDANHWTVGVETEDDATPSKPWTDAQIDTIIDVCKQLKVPGKLLLETRSNGVGWHEQYPSWNQSNHGCPAGVREKQIRDIIIPRLATPTPGEEDDLAWVLTTI